MGRDGTVTRDRLPATPSPEEPTAPVRQTVRVPVIAQDPSVKDSSGAILTTELDIPAEHLDPGPRGARFYVVDYDPDTGTLEPPAEFDLETGIDPFPELTDELLTTDARFRALNVYAIAARTLSTFEAALGRRLEWASSDHQINLVPRAFAELNAYYSPEDGAVYFGHQEGGDGEVQTALSHDIVAHETTHAILDGLRPRYNEPGLPDQPAFHEALGDIVALLSVFSLPDVVQRLLGEADKAGRLRNEDVSPRSLRASALFGLAEELGADDESTRLLRSSGRGSSLRRSAGIQPDPGLLDQPEFQEAHRRGEIVVAAVMHTLVNIWEKRVEDLLVGAEGPSRERVAEEGARAADQLLRMVIRGIDYMPPVELEFTDVVEGIAKADEVVAPDDQRRYREYLIDMFAMFGIDRPAAEHGIADLSRSGPETAPPVYERMNYAILRSSPDEVSRFIWENADSFGIDRHWHTVVTSVRPSVRIGPDGLIVNEVVAEYTQTVNVTVHDLTADPPRVPDELRFEPPAGMAPDTQLQLWGGGVLVFDQFGRAKFHVRKPLADGDRQRRRLEYLVERELSDTQGRFGFTLSQPRGQRFAALHVADDRAGERW